MEHINKLMFFLNLKINNQRIISRWTNEECLLAVQGVRKYGRDFKAISEVIGNKTEGHVKTFFVNHERRYNLNSVLKEYEADHNDEMDGIDGKGDKIDSNS